MDRARVMRLDHLSELMKALSDPTRFRLLRLLADQELSVAELADCTDLPQPRVSSHLARLKEAGLVRDRRVGVYSFYRQAAEVPSQALGLLDAAQDGVLDADLARRNALIAARTSQRWPDRVAGDMERHYSPGRTWSFLARSLVRLIDFGDVVDLGSGDGLFARLIAPRAKSVTCIDLSAKVVEAGQVQLAKLPTVRFVLGDMHQPPLPPRSADQVFALNALVYAEQPRTVIAAAAQLLRPGGLLVVSTLKAHDHGDLIADYGHANLGQHEAELVQAARAAALVEIEVGSLGRERRPPHFEGLLLTARRRSID